MSNFRSYDAFDGKEKSQNVLENEARQKKLNMQRCPVCGIYESFITNIHCVREHGMTKKEVESQYGKILNEYDRKRVEMKNA